MGSGARDQPGSPPKKNEALDEQTQEESPASEAQEAQEAKDAPEASQDSAA